MSDPTPFVPAPTEKTFTAFTNAQGANYARNRPGYHPNLYKTVIEHHTSTGGKVDVLLDVGCGPGTTARALASQFTHAIGLDPSEGMINNARQLGGVSSANEPIRYEVSAAEDLGRHLTPPIEDESVDLITASTAAHWFDMAHFWPRAARVLKPGGSVALWTTGKPRIHQDTPNATAIQATLDDLNENALHPYHADGHFLAANLYQDLPLPWTLTNPVPEFDQSSFLRKVSGSDDEGALFIGAGTTFDLATVEKLYSTTSSAQRWREAHPDDAGTERDVIKIKLKEVKQLLHEAGVEEGKEVLKGSMIGVLLIVKKKGDN